MSKQSKYKESPQIIYLRIFNILEYIKGNLEGWIYLFIYWTKLLHLAQGDNFTKIEHDHCQNPAETNVAGSTQVKFSPAGYHPTKLPYQLPNST